MHHVAIDDYVLDTLMPDLVGHDRSPAAFLIYIVLWTQLFRSEERATAVSLQKLSELSGLSKSAVQKAVRLLRHRGLIKISKTNETSVPEYELVRHWISRRVRR